MPGVYIGSCLRRNDDYDGRHCKRRREKNDEDIIIIFYAHPRVGGRGAGAAAEAAAVPFVKGRWAAMGTTGGR